MIKNSNSSMLVCSYEFSIVFINHWIIHSSS